MNFRKIAMMLASLLVFCIMSAAWAVIKVDQPVSKRFAISKTVIVGKVTAVNADKGLVEVTTVERLKDDSSPANFRIHIVEPAALIQSVKVGQPVVLLAKKGVSIHLADTWLQAEAAESKGTPLWQTTAADTKSAGKTFPGTTASLVRALEEIKAGKPTLLDDFEGKVFTGGVKEIAKLDVSKPTFLLSVDVNGDGKPDLVIGTSTGVKLFLASADGFSDVTEKWGLKGIAASSAAAGDVTGSGKGDLLLDGTLYTNDGQKFSPASPAIKLDANAHVLASALIDATGSGKRDAAILLGDGQLLVFKNPGQTSTPWSKSVDRKLGTPVVPQSAVFGDFSGDGKSAVAIVSEKSVMVFPLNADEPAIDFGRLTGDAIDRIKGFTGGIKNPVITAIDINADHRPDLLITGDGAAMILVNRGFGAFLPDSDAGTELNTALAKSLPAGLTATSARAAAKNASGGEDLMVLLDDGHLLLVGNPASAAK